MLIIDWWLNIATMDPLYNSHCLEDNRLGSIPTILGLSEVNTSERSKVPFRNTARTLPLHSGYAGPATTQAEPFMPYGEAASDSLWDSQLLKSCVDTPPAHTTRIQPTRNRLRGTDGFTRQVSGSSCSALDSAAKRVAGVASSSLAESPTVSTSATLSALPQSLIADIPEWGRLSRDLAPSLSGSIGGTTRLHKSQALTQSSMGTHGSQIQRGASTRSSAFSQLLPSVSTLTAMCPVVSPATTGVPLSEVIDDSSRLRAVSSSGLKIGGMPTITAIRNRRFSLVQPTPMSSSLTHLHSSLSSPLTVQQPFNSYTTGTSLADVGPSPAQLARHAPYAPRIGTYDLNSIQPKDLGNSSSSTLFLHATSQAFQPNLVRSNPPLDSKGILSTPSRRGIERQDIQSGGVWTSSQDGAVGGLEENVSGDGPPNSSQCLDSCAILPRSRSTPGPRTERVKAFLGFLKELYLDQDLIPACSVVDCLVTLASYAQGLPAVQGASLPWCCVAGQEIVSASTDPVCLKDRVVVKLLNTLMRAQVLECAQVPAEPNSGRTCFPAASKSCNGLGKNPLSLVLSSCPLDSLRVSLRLSSECGEPTGSCAQEVIPLAWCSSVALAVSAIETISRHHMPMGVSLSPNSSPNVHLCYSSFLRWLWKELCSRRQQSAPFDICATLLACEACSSSICSEAEIASMLPMPASLNGWLDSCNIDLAVLLLLSLASRHTPHPLTAQLLERTSFSLDKCTAFGLAAWLRASAVMGLSAVENPASFGRVMTAVAAQIPQMPLGTVLADVLWGLTLCGIPSESFFLQAAPSIACNMHMFELEDLCLIGCCYALQKRGFAGVTRDSRRWSYGGHLLPLEFFRRLTGLKAYCLAGSGKMADTGPTPVLSGEGYASETTGSPHGGGLIGEISMHQRGVAANGVWTPDELIHAILGKCQALRGYISLNACRLLNFTERVMEKPSGTDHRERDFNRLRCTADFRADMKPSDHVEEFQETDGSSSGPACTRPLTTGAARRAFPPSITESCLPPRSFMADSVDEQTFHSPRASNCLQVPLKNGTFCQASPSECPGEDEVASSGNPGQTKFEGGPCGDACMGPKGSMWGDQYVPAPAGVSMLHSYGVKAHTGGAPGGSTTGRFVSLFRQILAFWGSCVSFAAHALYGYFFLVLVIYAFSLWS